MSSLQKKSVREDASNTEDFFIPKFKADFEPIMHSYYKMPYFFSDWKNNHPLTYMSTTITTKQKNEIESIVNMKITEMMDSIRRMLDPSIKYSLQSQEVTSNNLRHSLDSPYSSVYAIAYMESAIENAFDGIDSLLRVCYYYTDGKLELIIVHEHENPELIFDEMINRTINLEDDLPDIRIMPMVYLSSEIEPRHLEGMKDVIKKG